MAGAGVYTYQLVRTLARVAREHTLIVFARPGLFEDLISPRFHVLEIEPPLPAARIAWAQIALPALLRRLRIDVLHSPHHDTPLAAQGVKRVVTVHDVTFLLVPKRYTLARRLYMEAATRLSRHAADVVITPSNAVRDDVLRLVGVPANRLVTIHEAPASQYRVVDGDTLGRVRWKHRLPNRYVLSVGSLEPGKNRARLLRAFARMSDIGDCPLVVAGQPAWDYESDYALVRQLDLGDRVRFLGYVPDEDLPAIYTGATVFAFPSLYEGFGLPVLEAMACGAPVVTSNVSATAEVAGDAALLVNPLDELEIEEALRRLLFDETLRQDLRDRGLERAAEFSWERTARDTLTVYEAVAATR